MAATYNLPSESMNKIKRWLTAKKAAGVVVQPWEYEQAVKAEMDSLNTVRNQGRALDISEAQLAENKRQADVNESLRRDEIASGEKAGTKSLVSQVGTTALLYSALKPKKTVDPNAPKETSMWDSISNWFNKKPAGDTKVTPGTPESYNMTGDLNGPVYDTNYPSSRMPGETVKTYNAQGNVVESSPVESGASSYNVGPSVTEGAVKPAGAVTVSEGAKTIPYDTSGTQSGPVYQETYPSSSGAAATEAGGAAASDAGVSSVGGVANIIGAIIGAAKTKEAGKKYIDSGGIKGYAGRSSQHPFAAVADPTLGTAFQDMGLPGYPKKDTAVGKVIGLPAKVEEKTAGPVVDWIGEKCCFIFIAAYDELLPIVRLYRDEHMNEDNRRGYYRLSDKIVPIMKRSSACKWLVRFFMTGPMVSYGKYFYGRGKLGVIFKPVTKFWLGIFEILGKKKPYVRVNGEIV